MNKLLLITLLLIANFSFVEAEEYPRTRPDENSGPTKVQISLYVIDIEDINNKDQSFTCDVVYD